MRGGEVLGGYGYAERDEYSKARGDLNETEHRLATGEEAPPGDIRT
jgi:hypothetical protein